MKAERKVETIIYKDIEFPILLVNCPMKKKFGKFGTWFLDINFEKLQSDLLEMLIRKPAPLTGEEIRFIRKYFEYTTTEFGKAFCVTHSAVLKWENGHLPIPTTDFYIRLFVLEKLSKKDAEFGKLYREVHIENLRKTHAITPEPLTIQADEYLVTA